MNPRFLSVLPLVVLVFPLPVAADGDACGLTVEAALRSCRAGARGDQWRALGKCDNVADPAERSDCTREASAELDDALDLCDSQRAVRQAACARFGPGAYDPSIDPGNFVATVDNPYFPLTPGTAFIYEGRSAAGLVHNEFFVTRRTRQILGVTTVEVHDTVTTDGELTEDTLDWFAQDRDGNVWYFGENTMELAGGRPSTLEGTFTAGVERAKPGIIMEAHAAIGDFYRQEFDLGNAEDFAEVRRLSDTVTVPAGTFTRCLRARETTPLEPDLKEAKWYAAGVGNVLTKDLTTGERLELVRIEHR